MLNFILFGPPGSGKGTQAVQLAEKFDLVHISTGDLFRYEMSNNTPLGTKAKEYMAKGELVPDAITIGMLKNKMESTTDAKGFILDGFPRTIPQAQALDDLLCDADQEVTGLISLVVPDDELVKRILIRSETSGRADDSDKNIIRNRIEVYNKETSPVFEFYNVVNKAHTIEGVGTIDEIFGRLCDVMTQLGA
jgi:adenylate kinase